MTRRSPQSRVRSGPRHQAARRALIAQTRPGTPCPRCLRPMVAVGGLWGAGLHADHLSVEAVLRPGGLPDALSHKRCNELHGAMLGAALRGVTDPDERRRRVAEVTERCHAQLRGHRPGKHDPQPKRVSRW